MKCSYHPEIDAIGVCITCGKGLCTECRVALTGKMHCQSCADQAFSLAIASDTEVSASYYLLPVFFGLIGGIIAYFINGNYKKNRNRAKNMLGLGIIITIMTIIPIWLIFWSIFSVPWY